MKNRDTAAGAARKSGVPANPHPSKNNAGESPGSGLASELNTPTQTKNEEVIDNVDKLRQMARYATAMQANAQHFSPTTQRHIDLLHTAMKAEWLEWTISIL